MVKIKPKIKITKKKKFAVPGQNDSNVEGKKTKKLLRKKFKKNKIIAKKQNKKNPSINHFNLDSHFIFDNDEGEKFFRNIKNKNYIKASTNEIMHLNEYIEKIDLTNESLKNSIFVPIKKETFNIIQNYVKIKEINDPLSSFIRSKFESTQNRNIYICRKLSNLFFEETGQKTNRTTVNNIIRKKLGYHFLKTTPKNNKINLKKNRIISLAFIKIILRALTLGFKFIYLDESNINNKNNNYRCFRKANEQIYFDYKNFKKLNLLMAIDEKSVILYKLIKETTTEKTFLEFLEELLNEIKIRKIEKYILIMDNLSSHKTEELIKFYKANNINVVFNSPYISQWNSIELAFRAIKKQYYQKIFETEENLEEYVSKIINSEEFSKTIFLNFGETLKEYRKFVLETNDLNLNYFENEY